MRIKINLQIFLFAIIFAITHQIKIYACIMAFAFIHELAHMLTGIILKLKPKSLNFMPFGISIVFEDYGYKKLLETKKLIIAIAGPMINLIIAILFYFLHIKLELKEMIIYSNFLIFLFNLIPLYPLDGGRILKCLIRLKENEFKSDEKINRISNTSIIVITAISSILILYLRNIAIIFVLIYLWIIMFKENKRFKIKKNLYNTIKKENISIDI